VSPRTFSPQSGATITIAVNSAAGTRTVAGVHDSRGFRISELGTALESPSVFVWDGGADDGQRVAPGLYIVVVEFYAGSGVRLDTRKVVVGCAAR
jgi:hypothetical protein